MMLKNLRKRPLMKWLFASSSFEVIVDKGGLDALMGEDTSGSEDAGGRLLSEVARLLCLEKGATYICVTLAQTHVLKKLLSAFQSGWSIKLHQLPPSPDMAGSPLQPVLAVVRRCHEQQDGGLESFASLPVELDFAEDPSCCNAEQLHDIIQVVADENAARSLGQQQDMEDIFARLHPGARIVLPCLPIPERHKADLSQEASHNGGHADSEGQASYFPAGCQEDSAPLGNSKARFSAVVLDNQHEALERAVHECCVFIVPQGREHEWLFATAEGHWAVAADCMSKRVILVVLNRGHAFKGTAAVNKELSPLVKDLAPADVRELEKKIPILTTSEGIGERVVLEEAESVINGHISVEDVKVQLPDAEDAADMHWLRRMVFTSNRNLTQSEAYLIPATAANSAQGKNKASKKGKARNSKEIDEGYRAMVPSYEILASEYHSAMVAGLSLIADPLLERRQKQGKHGSVLVVGLGGGALPIYLHSCLGLSVDCVELDVTVVGLARRHFGFADVSSQPSLTARVGDGLEAVAELAHAPDAPTLDVLIVDAGSGDASLAMTCPPAAFLGERFLTDAHAAVRPDGLLIVNCVSRSAEAFSKATQALQAVFAEVYELGMETDVNKVLFAARTALPDSVRGKVGRSAKSAMQLVAKLLPLAASDSESASLEVPLDAPLVTQLQALKLVERAHETEPQKQ
ncbi:g3860 [Coccomyxa elongata]